MLTALFGITNDALNLVVSLMVLFLVVLWLALVAWTYFDARRRLEDGFLVVCAVACSFLFPFLGTIVYSILRPPEFLSDRRERELEIRASELRVRQLEEQSCPNCEHPVERTFLRCPNCRARIKDPCESCGKPIDPRWAICPYCEMPRRAAAPERRPERPEKRRRPKPAPASQAPPRGDRRVGGRQAHSGHGPRAGSNGDESGRRPADEPGRREAGAQVRRRAPDPIGARARSAARPAPRSPSRASSAGAPGSVPRACASLPRRWQTSREP